MRKINERNYEYTVQHSIFCKHKVIVMMNVTYVIKQWGSKERNIAHSIHHNIIDKLHWII